MVGYEDGLCTKHISLFSTCHIHDAIADAESEVPMIVHYCGYCQVCQCEQSPSLTYVSAVKMVFRHLHLSHSMQSINFSNPATGVCSKSVVSIK